MISIDNAESLLEVTVLFEHEIGAGSFAEAPHLVPDRSLVLLQQLDVILLLNLMHLAFGLCFEVDFEPFQLLLPELDQLVSVILVQDDGFDVQWKRFALNALSDVLLDRYEFVVNHLRLGLVDLIDCFLELVLASLFCHFETWRLYIGQRLVGSLRHQNGLHFLNLFRELHFAEI